MDIWKWVNQAQSQLREGEHGRLADLIEEVSQHVADGRQDLAQAVLPEALATVRSLQQPWLEVYFRHWVMNGRVTTGKEGGTALKETVALFEFAHRPDTIECPQSVCTTQDLSSCYGNVDGPGWAGERIAVCEETLARIDPGWGCYSCISIELISALIDADQAPKAVALAEQRLRALRESGEEPRVDFLVARGRALMAAGDCAGALQALTLIGDDDLQDETAAQRAQLRGLQAHILARMGRVEQAWDALPDEDADTPFSDDHDFVAAVALIAAQLPQHNTYLLGRRIKAVLAQYSKGGVHRTTLAVAELHVRLALARGARWTAQQALAVARPHLAQLRAPMGAPALLAELDSLVAALPVAGALPVPAEQLVAHVRERADGSPEQDVEWLLAAAAQLPDDAELAITVAMAMRGCGDEGAARDYLWERVRRAPTVHPIGSQLVESLMTLRDHDGLEQLAQLLAEPNPSLSHWCRARIAYAREAWAEAGEHVRRLLDVNPNAHGPKRLWSDAAMAAKDFDTALRLRAELVEQETEIGNLHWDLMVAASAAQRWDVVRSTAAALDFTLDGSEGVVDEQWGSIRLRFAERQGHAERYARRTGPATARVRSLSTTDTPQRVRDWIVYDPYPLEAVPSDAAERADFIQLYDAVHLLQSGDFGPSRLVDGVYPGDAAFALLTDALDALDWEWSVRSHDDYSVSDATSDETLPGIYFLVAAPNSVMPVQIDQKLRELTAGYAHPLCWLGLARAAGVDDGQHLAIAERYGL